MIDANEPLQAYERSLMTRFELLLAEAVAADLGDAPTDLRPRLVAAAATSALTTLRPDPDAPTLPHDATLFEPVDNALVFLRGGIAALQHRDAPD